MPNEQDNLSLPKNIQESPAMNVYQMYVANGNRAGFWIRRGTWGKWRALVKTVAGKVEGPLPGRPPYYGNPSVVADIFQHGEPVKIDFVISCPGTYSYSWIEEVTKSVDGK